MPTTNGINCARSTPTKRKHETSPHTSVRKCLYQQTKLNFQPLNPEKKQKLDTESINEKVLSENCANTSNTFNELNSSNALNELKNDETNASLNNSVSWDSFANEDESLSAPEKENINPHKNQDNVVKNKNFDSKNENSDSLINDTINTDNQSDNEPITENHDNLIDPSESKDDSNKNKIMPEESIVNENVTSEIDTFDNVASTSSNLADSVTKDTDASSCQNPDASTVKNPDASAAQNSDEEFFVEKIVQRKTDGDVS